VADAAASAWNLEAGIYIGPPSVLFAQSIAIWQEPGDENSAAKVRDLAQRALESRQKG